LRAPVVADRLGALYNREAVLEWILARRGAAADAAAVHRFANQIRTSGAGFSHLTGIRDVFPVVGLPAAAAEAEAAAAAAAAGGSGVSSSVSRSAAAAPAAGGAGGGGSGEAADEAPLYCCPITGLPCGRYTMVALVPCGHIISQRALERLGAAPASSSGAARKQDGVAAVAAAAARHHLHECPVCGVQFTPGEDDAIVNGSEEQVRAMRGRMELRKESKGGGSGKRKRNKAAAAVATAEAVAGGDERAEGSAAAAEKLKGKGEEVGRAAAPEAEEADAAQQQRLMPPPPPHPGKRVRIATP
jgi:hypothetical protein